MNHEQPSRQICLKCWRVQRYCYCSRIKSFIFEPRIVLLVHPREARNSVGTARLAALSVSNSIFWSGNGSDFDAHLGLNRLLSDPELYPVVLFPGSNSLNLSKSQPQDLSQWIPNGKKLAIIVIDGTWSMAKKMVRMSRVLSVLPRVSFDVLQPSQYQFRRQPKAHCLSTVEAIHLLIENLHHCGLASLPADRAHDQMIETFKWIVKTQLQLPL